MEQETLNTIIQELNNIDKKDDEQKFGTYDTCQ